MGNAEKSFAAQFPPCATILENKSKALGIKLSFLREHLAIQRSSENIDPEEIVDGILLDKWGIRPVSNGNLSLLSKKIIYQKRYSIDKSLFSKLSSSGTL